jgi:UDP-N-acetyl-D-mannosaminuronic acid dehydrogenase
MAKYKKNDSKMKNKSSILTQNLQNKILQKKAHIAIVGTGYVGLPTAALFADSGFSVMAVDVRPAIIKSINNGKSPINEPGLQKIISKTIKNGKLKANLSSKISFKDQDVIIISVQTPIDKTFQPDFSYLIKAVEKVGNNLQKGSLVVICSTIPPGTIHEKMISKLTSLSLLLPEKEFFLAYVPERIAPGKALKEFREGQRIIGGIGPNSTKLASILFKTICKTTIETNAKTAEIAKLSENTYRDVNIAFANQLALICEQKNVDVKEVIHIANTHPRVDIHNPGPGVGGPCLTKDPYLLIYNTNLDKKNLIKVAREKNNQMPNHVIKMIIEGIKKVNKKINQSTISVFGTAYKANVDDPRFSPSEIIIKKLLKLKANVIAYDPFCKQTFGAKKVFSIHKTLTNSDCLAILTDHTEFKTIKLNKIKQIMAKNPIIIDGKRIFDPKKAEKYGFIYYGVGYTKN